MGDSIEQWRATIGQWSGGRPRNVGTSQHHIAQTSNLIGYKQIRFLVLLSLLVIGCVELNPGPDHETSAPTQSDGALPKFHRRPRTHGKHGELYGSKTATFLFARALYKTEEFRLTSNVDGAGAFDDLVFRYRLKEPDVWKTCFIKLKHKKNGGKIQRSSLTQMYGNFSLFKYFKSYCEIKNNAATHRNLKECGPFVDFEFAIYTNQNFESNSPPQEGVSDPLSILSSGTDYGKYITFDKYSDQDIFEFFEEVSGCKNLIGELDSLLKGSNSVDGTIKEKIKELQISVKNKTILEDLKKMGNTGYVPEWIHEVAKCDFTLFDEFLSKVKIFHSQSNEEALKGLIKKELQQACKASPSVANFIYKKVKEGFSDWWTRDGNVVWLNENSELWEEVQTDIITKIKKISKPEIQEIVKCGIRFNEQHVQKLSDAIARNTVLNIVINSNICNLQKMKTYQVLNNLGYINSLFIGIKSLKKTCKKIHKLWPSKWIDVLVVDCVSDGNVAQTVLDILQQSADCDEVLDKSDDNTAGSLVDILQKYQQKLILISTEQMASVCQEKLRNVSYFEDNYNLSDLDEVSQKQILERPVKFQGTNVALSTLIGTEPPASIKAHLDSDVISILLSKELSVGRQLDDHPKYYVPRVLQHQIYLKEDILKRTDYAITFAVSGLQSGELKNYLPAGEEICELIYDETNRSHYFKIVSDFSNSDLSAELEDMKTYTESGQNVKPEEVKYIILGNKNPENEFKELKKLLRKVHWIHVEEDSFLWRDSNCNIDNIHMYVDNTKCEKYYEMKNVLEHKDRTMLLIAEAGMGKSTFLYYLPHEIKKWNPSVWVLRINLIEHTKEFEDTDFEQKCFDKCKMFLWNAAHSPGQDVLEVTEQIFLQAMNQTGKMVVMLDGFDEISPYYGSKVQMLINAIRDETASKIWISSRFSCQLELEKNLEKFAFTLQPFTPENKIQFLEQYWTEVAEISNQEALKFFANELLTLCSQNFSDEDGEFTGIPLQTMMLGEAFVNEATEYCCSREFNLPIKFNLLDLFQKFSEKKFQVYFKVKSGIDTERPEVKTIMKDYLEKHMISALLFLFSQKEMEELRGAICASSLEQTKSFLCEGEAHKFGIIREISDGNPLFIHRCFGEYFAAKWFADNFRKCKEFISDILFESTKEVTRNMFDRMLANHSEIHGSVLNNNIDALNEILGKGTDINTLDAGGRTALHLAASYNSQCIQQLLSFEGIDANITDEVLKWTPLRYADRTKSWMAMDILLQNGANPDDIVLSKPNSESQERVQRALWECASEGHIKLLEFILNCGIEVNAPVDVPENLHENCTLLHRASYCGEMEVVRRIVNRGAHINIRDANDNTALHLAAESGRVDIIKFLMEEGTSVNLTNTYCNTPLHVSVQFGRLEATKLLVERGAALNRTNKYGNTPLMVAAHKGKLEIIRYLTEKGADINVSNKDNNTVLHSASASGSVDIIKVLLDEGMSVNLTNKYEFTPLHLSARYGHLEATKTLVQRGSDVDSTNKYDHTPLMVAAYNDKLEIFRYLIDNGADIHFRNHEGNTIIRYTAKSGNVEMIKLLLGNGMSVNETDKKGSTPLHGTAQFGHLEATKLLVERGANVDKINNYGKTPLMLAAYENKLEIFLYLTDIGSDVNIRDPNENTALHYAAESGSVDIIKLLLDKGMSVNLTDKDDNTPLHVSAYIGHLKATRLFVARGAAINNTNKLGRTPLMMAAYTGKLDIFRYFTEIGSDINIRDANNSTALHLAAFSGSVDIINSLLDDGMSVNLKNIHAFTPLHTSVHFGHLGASKTLVERGAALNNTDKYGNTPLLVAAHKGKIEIFRCLTEKGADIKVCNDDNNTALHLASVSGSVDIINLLLDKGVSVNLTNRDDCTSLHVSAEFGHLEATKLLVERGAAINNIDKYGNTPLMLALHNDKLQLCRYLKGIGADINILGAQNNYGIEFCKYHTDNLM